MTILSLFRTIALIATAVFAAVVLGLSIHLTYLTEKFFGGYLNFAVLAIATSFLTVASIPVLIIVDLIRNGAFTSKILFELVWLSILWILSLTTAGMAADANSKSFNGNCNWKNSNLVTACHEFSGIEAFSFLNWIILMIYTFTILVFSIVAASHGQNVLYSSVKHASFSSPDEEANEKYESQQGTTPAVPQQPQYPQNPQMSVPQNYVPPVVQSPHSPYPEV